MWYLSGLGKAYIYFFDLWVTRLPFTKNTVISKKHVKEEDPPEVT